MWAMEDLAGFLTQYGAWGMFVSAFLAGSFLPFSSEVVMLALLEAGTGTTELVWSATAGNVLGGMFNYGVGRMGREEWIERYAKVSPEKLERGKRWVRRYGAWAGLLAWVPLLGSLTTVALGYLRANPWLSLLTVFTGKYLRYLLLVRAFLAV